ncbi:ABC transporter permease [Pseudoduganella namucuonensis]|uniref:Ribose transport system permease protein n=1 Tax=Pseudoduganella namucuonensis TaxID=1035707 RepID=A0A1I7KHQ0_9BURK|nr:ABC transporter permease [Pseudoduganella namucuonensis]SFU96874.1 ribose transport system permease protein [Pseudoduganella namucuonensis]
MDGPAPAARRPALAPALAAAIPLAVPLALLAGLGLVEPAFLSLDNLGMMAGESSVLLLLAGGQTLVILLGGIDLSMAALAALASVLLALALPGMGAGAVPAVLALTAAIGLCQGLAHVRGQLPSLVVTLAGGAICAGVALTLGHATIPVTDGYGAVGWLEGASLGVPHSFAFALAALTALAACLRWLAFGRRVYAVGLNPRAALLSGVRVGRVKLAAFTLSGLFSGLAGMALVARTYSGSPSIADSLLLPSIAAVLIGGNAITGGVGGMGRTLAGVLTLTVLRIGIAAAGLDPAYEPIVYGVLIVLAAALTIDRSKIGVTK